jgi:ABC-type glycerol-3-phosphate transport system substrate-binding protein
MLSHPKMLHVLSVVLCTVGLGAAIPVAYAQGSSSGANEITFTSWVGPYMRSQMLGFVRPYEAENGVRVNVVGYNGGISEIRDQVESANVTWDVVGGWAGRG